MGRPIDQFTGMTAAERDVLRQLFFQGPTFDGDVSSKTGRNGLIDRGFADRVEGHAFLTRAGVEHALSIDLDTAKDRWDRERRAKR